MPTLLLLFGFGALVWVISQKQPSKQLPAAELEPETPPYSPPSIEPQQPDIDVFDSSMVALYEKCSRGECSLEEWTRVSTYISQLIMRGGWTPAELAWLMNVANEFAAMRPDAAPLSWSDIYEKCYRGECTFAEWQSLVDYVDSQIVQGGTQNEMQRWLEVKRNVALMRPRTAGVVTGACCASCAIGGPCEGDCPDKEEKLIGA